MHKTAPQGIVAQQFAHREIESAKPGDIVGLVGSMQVDSINFIGAPIGQIITISDDRKSWVVVELFASMIVEQTAGTGGVTAGDRVKTAIVAGAATDITTLATARATLVTAQATQTTDQTAYDAAVVALAADPTNVTLQGDVTTALGTLNVAIAATAVAQVAVDAALAALAALAMDSNTVVTADPVGTAADIPLTWGRALNTATIGQTVSVLPF